MGIFDKLFRFVRGSAADDAVVTELLALLRLPTPEPRESTRMQELGGALSASTGRARATANELLEKLIAAFDAPHPQSAGVVAVLCGAVVEDGADAAVLSAPLIKRAARAFRDALPLLEASRSVAEAPEGEGILIGRRWIPSSWVHAHVNVNAVPVQSLLALDMFSVSLAATLSRCPQLLRSPEVDALFELIEQLGTTGEAMCMLERLLRVPVDETWVLLDPARDLGFELAVTGVADAFQVHALLHRALQRTGKWDDAPPGDVMRVADGTGPCASAASYAPPFALFRWPAIDGSARVPDVSTHLADWYSNSAVPAELARHEGRRIAVLGTSSIQMQLAVRRCFPALRASVEMKRRLAGPETAALRDALVSAPRPEHPAPFVGWR